MTDQPQVPDELQVPRFRFWGQRQPPKNRADMFSTSVARAAADTGSTSSTPGSVATLRIYGPIDSWGGWWGISAKEVAKALDELPADVDEIRVRINSPGGEAWEGLAILNLLRAHRTRAVAVVDGLAASAASIVAAGCDETVMSPGTQMMIHDASAFAYGPAAIMRKAATFLDSVSNSLASIYAEAAGGTDADWRAAMVEETWYTAQEAVDAGLADRVAVVSDAGETSTAGDDPEIVEVVEPSEDPENSFDLSLFTYAGRAAAPSPSAHHEPPAQPPGNPNPNPEGAGIMSDTLNQGLRERLGVTDAELDETGLLAALDEALGEQSTTPPAPSVPAAGTVVVDEAQYAELVAASTQGAEARAQQLREERERLVAAAVDDGRIPPARREAWTQMLETDPGSKDVLASLKPGLVPLTELGGGQQPDTAGESAYAGLYGNDEQKG